jgi:hypothetical protein|tara:strand:+ start:254 stop:601 length:348 start_codon:yes stop_codon:yes gene_type:complete
MKINKFEITENEGNISVFVELHHRIDGRVEKSVFKTKDVLTQLQERNIEHGDCVKECSLYNWREAGLRGTWIFSKKALDKPVEDVILEVEKEVKPKPVRKKRTRTSIKKKISTGE